MILAHCAVYFLDSDSNSIEVEDAQNLTAFEAFNLTLVLHIETFFCCVRELLKFPSFFIGKVTSDLFSLSLSPYIKLGPDRAEGRTDFLKMPGGGKGQGSDKFFYQVWKKKNAFFALKIAFLGPKFPKFSAGVQSRTRRLRGDYSSPCPP